MPEFLDRIFGREPAKKTGIVAKERLQFILVHDRINLPPERMEAMKKEILEVIAKYVSVDNENVEIALEKRERNSALVAEIPFIKAYEDKEYEEPDEDEARQRIFSDDDDEDENADEPVSKPPADEQPASAPPPSDDQPALDDLASAETPSEDKPPADEPPPPATKPKQNYAPKRKR
jgi:cell division topological specificity factor